jgi:DNA polymerase elongation subunit (family B)
MQPEPNSFRLFDFQVRDEVPGTQSQLSGSGSSSGSSRSGPKKFSKDKKRLTIQMFGINEQGETCCIIVRDYEPFFYAKVPETWGFEAKARFIAELKKAVGKFSEDSILTDECKLLRRKTLYGFDGGKDHKFLMLKFKNTATMNKVKALWYIRKGTNSEMRLNHRGYNDTQIYEANIPPLLRYFHIKDISPSGWVKIKGEPIDSNKQTTCSYEYCVGHKCVVPQPEKETLVPYKIMSFDIEASSSHGDFPVPIKTYKKLATNIVDVCLKEPAAATKSEVQRMIRTAFHDPKKSEPLFTLHDDIERIYAKTIPTKEQLDAMFERMWSTPVQTLVQEADPEALTVNTIERMFEKQRAEADAEFADNDNDGDDADDAADDKSVFTTATAWTKPNTNPNPNANPNPSGPSSSDKSIADMLQSAGLDRETKINHMNDALLAVFPPVEGDKVTFIGSTFLRYGESRPYLNHCLALGTCDPVPRAQIETCKTERALLQAWTALVQREDPDIIIGYNIFGFDYNFMFRRALENHVEDDFLKLSRNADEFCGKRDFKTGRVSIEETSIALASGQYDLHYIAMPGRLQIDMYNYFRRDYNLTSYKLDYVGSYFIGDNVLNCEHRVEADSRGTNVPRTPPSQLSPPSEYDGKVTRIFSKNLVGLEVGNYIELEETGHSTDPYKDGQKFQVVAVNREAGHFEIVGHETPDLTKHVRWGVSKDDVTPQDIFRMTNEGPGPRAVIAKYCIQDCNLVHHLMNKVDVITGYNEMAKICSVPISFLVIRGQGIKLTSYMAKKCREKNTLMPVIDKGPSGEGYEGAIVLPPKRGLYLDNPVACNDYSSLYPSSMISENLSHDSKVWTKEYDLDGNLVRETGEKDPKTRQHLYDNLPEYDYVDVEYDTYRWKPNPRGKMEKHLSGKKVCRFAQFKHGAKAILPSILEELLAARKATRKLAEQQSDPFMANVLDKRQLAYKVTANSLYGQCGAKTSSFYEVDVAASTTATGRKLLTYAKRMVEEVYGDAECQTSKYGIVHTRAEYVYGDTDSIFYTFNLETLEGAPIRGKQALEITIELARQVGDMASAFLKAPHGWVYEKTLMPFGLLQKKRYFGILYETDPNKGKPKSMGIVLRRRDNAPIVKDVYGGLIDILTKQQDLEAAVQFVRGSLQSLVDECVPMDKLIITKSLRSTYKNPQQIAHKVLADRMGKRDPGNKPSSGDRIPFVYIHNADKKALQGERIETPDYIRAKRLKLNYSFYITNQIMKPVAQLFGLVLEQMAAFRRKKARFLEEMESVRSNWTESDDKLQKKLDDLRFKEVKELIFDDYLRQADNMAKSNKSITEFFAAKKK